MRQRVPFARGLVNKTERQLNLIALLLDTRRPLRASEIRARFDDYGAQSDDAFKRMFERDKTDIEALGFRIEREVVDAISEEIGYRIVSDSALLPDIGLEPDEMAALSLAAQSWRDPDGTFGLLKLSVGSAAAEPGPEAFVVPRVETDANVRALLDAIARRKRVRFSYRTGGDARAATRTVEPHALHHRGAWYLIGHDLDRGEARSFRLSRVDGDVRVEAGAQPDFAPAPKPRDAGRAPWEGDEVSVRAQVAFAPEVAWWVQRRTNAARVSERDDGWVVLETSVGDVDFFAGWLAGFGDTAVALSPPRLRDETIARLRAVAGDATPARTAKTKKPARKTGRA